MHALQPGRGQRVRACSRAAGQRGIRPGMPLTEARALWKQRPTAASPDASPATHWHTALYEPQKDDDQLRQLADWCHRFSPLVAFETPIDRGQEGVWPTAVAHQAPPYGCRRNECLYLDVSGLASLFRGERRLGQRIVGQLRRKGYHARVAIADTSGAAWGLAHFADHSPAIAAARSAAVDNPPHPLAALPLDSLRLPEETLHVLQHLGLERVEQLEALPRDSLQARFGDQLLQRLDQAAGRLEEPFLGCHPIPEFRAACQLEHASDQRTTIAALIQQTLPRVTGQLQQHGQGAVRLQCLLTCRHQHDEQRVVGSDQPPDASTVRLEIGLFRPSADCRHLAALIGMQLESLSLPGPVQRVVVWAPVTACLEQRQSELFADRNDRDRQQLGWLIDRLSSRLGRDHVLQVRLQADAEPERSFRYLPWAGSRRVTRKGRTTRRTAATNGSTEKTTAPGPTERPLQLLTPPRAIQVVAVVPDGPPVTLRDAGQQYTIIHCWGPERIETGWWRGRSLRRDYYRVETDSGQRFWIFRQLTDGKWFLQGWFD